MQSMITWIADEKYLANLAIFSIFYVFVWFPMFALDWYSNDKSREYL